MPEGVRVFALLEGWTEGGLKAGIEMEMVTGPLYEEEGGEIIAYKFRPA